MERMSFDELWIVWSDLCLSPVDSGYSGEDGKFSNLLQISMWLRRVDKADSLAELSIGKSDIRQEIVFI